MENITIALCTFAEKLQFSDLSHDVVVRTRMHMADYYIASVAGFGVNADFNKAVLDVVGDTAGSGQASVLFQERGFSATDAAFLNAVFAHGADMDDGNKYSAGHIGTHVIPAVLALAQCRGLLWKDVIVAVNVGYDFFNRIAAAAQPSLYSKGFHSTGIAGGIACAAACAKLLKLDADGIYNSVALAAVQSSGLIIIDESGQECKPINPANAARVGVFSAMMAEKGVNSPRNPLESKKGWFNAFCDEPDTSFILEGLGKHFTICDSYLKLYPTCRHTHSCMDAALNIREEMLGRGYHPEDIAQISIYLYPSAIKSAGSIRFPKTSGEAKFSICYSMAVCLVKGEFGLEHLEPDYSDQRIGNIIGISKLHVDSELENREKGIRGCRMEVVLSDGVCLDSTVLTPKGEGQQGLDWMDMERKAEACFHGIVGANAAKDLIHKCRQFDVERPFEPLF